MEEVQKEGEIEILKSIELHPTDKIMLALLAIVAVLLFIYVGQFQHIPSPIYGGDFYMARGFTQAILNGNPPWLDAYFNGYYTHYAWLSYVVTAGLVRLTGISLERMSTLLPAIIEIFYLLAAYLFGSALFKGRKYGLVFMLAAFATKFIDMKISGAMATMFMLYALYCLVKLEQGSRKHMIPLGIFMGLTAISHINVFFGLILLVGMTLAAHFIGDWLTRRNVVSATAEIIKAYALPLLIAVGFALLLVGPWIFVYHMKTLNPAQQYSTQDVNKLGIGWVAQVVSSLFIKTGFLPVIYGIVIFIGLVFCIMNRKHLEPRLVLLWLLASIIGASHYLITKPLLNFWTVPGYIWGAAVWAAEISMFVYGLKNLELMAKGLKVDSNIILGLGVIFLVALGLFSFGNFNDDQWVKYGKTIDAGTQVLFDTGTWMLDNTKASDVFLGNDESSFALSAMSGRKLVMVRRTHANYYVDVDKRYADGMVMLYGNNKSQVQRLISEYGVTYVYLDSMLMQYPMITSAKYSQYLADNGINFTIQNVRLDPAATDAPSYDSAVVPPQELKILTYNITEGSKQFGIGNQLHSIFFKIIQ